MVIPYILGMLVPWAGIYCGVLLGINSPEELKPGAPYLRLLGSVIYGLIIGVAISYLFAVPVNYTHYGLSILIVLLILSKVMEVHPFPVYTLMGFMLAFFIGHVEFFILLGSLLFLYGLPVGSEMVTPHSKHRRITTPRAQLFLRAWKASWGFFLLICGLFVFFLYTGA
ncbi:MAG: hypothetical protein ACOCWQ_05855 [Nanoarchaeota archaeon]